MVGNISLLAVLFMLMLSIFVQGEG
jgi:hypothetical protein